MTCPYRPELSLSDMPESVKKLKVDARGYPIPFFVDYLPDGTPEFRAADPKKLIACVKKSLCWVCGEPLNRSRLGFKATIAFTIGPMCAVNRISSEPPQHPECAEWSARNCPFLARPHMRRREDELINAKQFEDEDVQRGHAILRNPGVALVWYCAGFAIQPTKGGPLFQVGPLTRKPTWWAEGRQATREEVLRSIDSGFPHLFAACQHEATEQLRTAAERQLNLQLVEALKLVPA